MSPALNNLCWVNFFLQKHKNRSLQNRRGGISETRIRDDFALDRELQEEGMEIYNNPKNAHKNFLSLFLQTLFWSCLVWTTFLMKENFLTKKLIRSNKNKLFFSKFWKWNLWPKRLIRYVTLCPHLTDLERREKKSLQNTFFSTMDFYKIENCN